MKNGLIALFEVLLIGAVVYCNGLLIQTPMPDYWNGKLLSRYGQCVCDIAFLDIYLKNHPTVWEGYRARSQAYALQCLWQDVEANCTKAIELKADDLSSYSLRGYAYYEMDKNVEALRDFTHVIASGQGSADDYAIRSLIYDRTKEYAMASLDAQKAMEKSKSCARAFSARALSELHARQLNAALQDAMSACRLDPEMPLTNVVHARVLNESGQSQSALTAGNLALRHDPTYGATHWQIGVAQNRLGNHRKAIQSCTLALSLASSNELRAASYATRALARLEARQFEEALLDADAAIRLDSQCLDAFRTRALAYDQLKMPDKARETREALTRLEK